MVADPVPEIFQNKMFVQDDRNMHVKLNNSLNTIH